jgi:hypothetical protein
MDTNITKIEAYLEESEQDMSAKYAGTLAANYILEQFDSLDERTIESLDEAIEVLKNVKSLAKEQIEAEGA